MKRQLFLALGCLLLLGGWISAFLLNSVPEYYNYLILGPTLLLGTGMGVVWKLLGGRLTAVTLALTAMLALVTYNTIYPRHPISIRAFQERMQETPQIQQQGHEIRIQTLAGEATHPLAARRFEVFADLEVRLFARLPGPVRMLAQADNGDIYASIPQLGAVYRLVDTDKDGYAEQPQLVSAGLDRPHGLAWRDGRLYIAETARLLVLDHPEQGDGDEPRVLIDDLPDDGGHWTRSLVFGADGMLYLSIGSRCNACQEADERRATVLQVDPASGHYLIFARGLRNSVGLTLALDGSLWSSDNGRDMLGDDLPPDEINLLQQDNDYGWPFCFGRNGVDPQLGTEATCRDKIASRIDLPAHSAPLGIAFGDGLAAPQEYRHSLFVALHGSWNRSEPTGYKLIRIPFVAGQPDGPPLDLVRGWLADGRAWGRPVALLVGADGALYVSDDVANVIYRFSWQEQAAGQEKGSAQSR